VPLALSNPIPHDDHAKWRHPMERVSPFYLEMEMITTQLHLTLDEWLKKPPKVRKIHLAFYRFWLARQAYYNTPPNERKFFFNPNQADAKNPIANVAGKNTSAHNTAQMMKARKNFPVNQNT